MKIIPLSEGAYTVDRTKVFVPFDETRDQLRDRPPGSLLVEVQPFLIITDQDILLLDTGLGFSNDQGTMIIHELMMNAGIHPSEVTKVLMSHLHKDHSGGVAINETALAFPTATYYVQKKELELAMSDSASYVTKDIRCLQHNERVQLLDGDGAINEYISYEMTGAHTPYHQVFRIMDGSAIIFFGGDDAPQLSQMKNRYVAKYDFDGRKCMELRQEWWKKGQEEEWTFLFYHDIKTPTYRV